LIDSRKTTRICRVPTTPRWESVLREAGLCRTCGDIADVDHATGDTRCLTPAGDAGHEVDEAEVVFWGRCARRVAESPGRVTTDQRRLDRAGP
jgi:Fe2+ or Zn2+ uptake regulation protein